MSVQGVLTGGLKRNSDVNVLPAVKEGWEEVRDDSNTSIDWLIAGYSPGSKTDITILSKGSGGIKGCSDSLPSKVPAFGGCRLSNGRFVTFFYADEETPTMQKGRASMHKNGVLNCLIGSDCEIEICQGQTEENTKLAVHSDGAASKSSFKSSTAQLVTQRENQPSPKIRSEVKTVPESSILKGDETNKSITANKSSVVKDIVTSDQLFFSYATLKSIKDVSNLPSQVDPTKREEFLSDEEFIDVFGMEKQNFRKLPTWKRKKMKQDRALF